MDCELERKLLTGNPRRLLAREGVPAERAKSSDSLRIDTGEVLH